MAYSIWPAGIASERETRPPPFVRMSRGPGTCSLAQDRYGHLCDLTQGNSGSEVNSEKLQLACSLRLELVS